MTLPFTIIRTKTFMDLQTHVSNFHAIARWAKLRQTNHASLKQFVLENIDLSYSQLQQDLVALYLSNIKVGNSRPKYFVEIGANDGISLSNTFMLETRHKWNGLLSEANKSLFEDLVKNRKHSRIDCRAVARFSGEKRVFLKAMDSEYSSLENVSIHEKSQFKVESIEVVTVNATDLLEENNAPSFIDFLSLDTEGNEFEILSGLNFNKFTFGFIAVEVTQNPLQIRELLMRNGYVQILKEVSAWDQWWVNAEWS